MSPGLLRAGLRMLAGLLASAQWGCLHFLPHLWALSRGQLTNGGDDPHFSLPGVLTHFRMTRPGSWLPSVKEHLGQGLVSWWLTLSLSPRVLELRVVRLRQWIPGVGDHQDPARELQLFKSSIGREPFNGLPGQSQTLIQAWGDWPCWHRDNWVQTPHPVPTEG